MPVHNGLAAMQCGAWWEIALDMATELKTKFKYKTC